jgi:hypothetical protein
MRMEIFLLLTVVVVGISSLYVAATLKTRSRQVTKPLIDDAITEISGKVDAALTGQSRELQSGLAQKGDVTTARQENARQLEQTTRLISDVRDQNGKTQEQLGQIADQVKDIASRLTIIELLTADPAAARTSSGEIPVTEVTDPNSPLAVAVLEAESDRERDGWNKAPQLYALVGKVAVSAADQELGARISTAPPNSLIPVKQEPLPSGEPLDVLARVQWPDDVTGCVLVTELVVLPPAADGEGPADPDQVEQWARDHPGGRPARLAVGVCRNGDYTCILRLKDEDDGVRLDPRLADDLVTALLATF